MNGAGFLLGGVYILAGLTTNKKGKTITLEQSFWVEGKSGLLQEEQGCESS